MPRCAEATCGRWRPGLGRRLLAGVWLNSRWFCSSACLAPTVRDGLMDATMPQESALARPALRLGAILRHRGAITQEQLVEALAAQRRSGLRLGAQLQTLGMASADVVLAALANQAGLSYLTSVDLSLVRRAPGGLSGATVRALGLVPFEIDAGRRRMHVLCTAPPPKAAFRALMALAGWHVDPYLVADAVWARAVAAYPNDAEVERASWAVPDADALAARVAHVAGSRGPVTLRRAACDGLVWVRLEHQASVEDLFLSTAKEEPCLVASTPR
jgi:hypothetical protein